MAVSATTTMIAVVRQAEHGGGHFGVAELRPVGEAEFVDDDEIIAQQVFR